MRTIIDRAGDENCAVVAAYRPWYSKTKIRYKVIIKWKPKGSFEQWRNFQIKRRFRTSDEAASWASECLDKRSVTPLPEAFYI